MWNIFKVNYKDTRTRSGVFIVNFEHISHLFLVLLLLPLNKQMFAGSYPVDSKTLKLFTTAIIDRCTEILVK